MRKVTTAAGVIFVPTPNERKTQSVSKAALNTTELLMLLRRATEAQSGGGDFDEAKLYSVFYSKLNGYTAGRLRVTFFFEHTAAIPVDLIHDSEIVASGDTIEFIVGGGKWQGILFDIPEPESFLGEVDVTYDWTGSPKTVEHIDVSAPPNVITLEGAL